MSTYDLILKNGHALITNKSGEIVNELTDIALKDGKIAEIGSIDSSKAKQNIDLKNLHILPGLIDTQVHFREPGLEHKEDLASGTRGAILGGITGVFEMPNTNPSTTDALMMKDKVSRAEQKSWSNFAFYMGASTDNSEKLESLENVPGCCGVKVFMGSSTGNLLVSDDDTLLRVLKSGKRRVAIHSEDDFRLNERKHLVQVKDAHPRLHPVWRDELTALSSTKRIIALAKKANRPLHILHLTTEQELDFLKDHKDICTIECTPQHLTLAAPECYDRLGSFAQMNPPIRTANHREALWKAVNSGLIDVIGSDHAPHTIEEKKRPYPQSPSGLTGVQTTVPLMLNHVSEKRLSLIRMVELLAARPSEIFKIKGKGSIQVGQDADFTVVDLKKEMTIKNSWIASKSGWTPFDGDKVTGWPVMTMIGGNIVMRDDEILGSPQGRAFEFS